MNNIYIINYNFDIIVELNFTNNTINKNNILYKFEIIDNDKILIQWENNNEIYYTEDSYLYFSDIKLNNIYKKYF